MKRDRALRRSAAGLLTLAAASCIGAAGLAQTRPAQGQPRGADSIAAQAAITATPAQANYYVRTSEYITVRDGSRLAVDVLRPAKNGRPVSGKLPVILQATPYQRAMMRDGKLMTSAEISPYLGHLLRNDYVVVALDIRGRGASMGEASNGDTGSDRDRWNLYDTVEWAAAQPWSSGAVGMTGCSYVGRTVYWTASTMPPHLKAIVPCSAPIDSYASVMRPGGVNNIAFLTRFDKMMEAMDQVGMPVDADADGALLKQAIGGRAARWKSGVAGTMPQRLQRPWRDSIWTRPEYAGSVANEWNYATNFAISRTPVLQIGGWRDLFTQDTIRWFRTLGEMQVPQRMVIGPWWHCQWYNDLELSNAEHLRWFDHYLKGIDNGVERQAPIRYFVMNAPEGQAWREADRWPLPGTTPTPFHLTGTKANSARSLNDGSLAAVAGSPGADSYTVDYATTSAATNTRWLIPQTPERNLDTAAIDARSLTYTSAPFEQGTEITGFPILSLWLESSSPNPDLFVYVSLIDKDGRATLMTDGQLRVANRTLRNPPWPSDGVPWQGGFAADLKPMRPGTPARVELALYPTSFYVAPGQRVRITINGFDKGNFDTPVEQKPPVLRILRDAAHPALVTLPIRRI